MCYQCMTEILVTYIIDQTQCRTRALVCICSCQHSHYTHEQNECHTPIISDYASTSKCTLAGECDIAFGLCHTLLGDQCSWSLCQQNKELHYSPCGAFSHITSYSIKNKSPSRQSSLQFSLQRGQTHCKLLSKMFSYVKGLLQRVQLHNQSPCTEFSHITSYPNNSCAVRWLKQSGCFMLPIMCNSTGFSYN